MPTESPRLSPARRVLLSFVIPLAGAIALAGGASILLGTPPGMEPSGRAGASLLFGATGVLSWLLGLRWYGLRQLGLRGGRSLYAGIGFASLGWLIFFLARLFLVSSNPDILVSRDFGRVFVYLFLFEALSVQLWTYGLLFRSLAAWRGPLTAAVMGGLVFGSVATLLFEEAFVATVSSLLYFVIWGVFYGLIRLRTGSILGTVVIQAMQSLTTWHILLPETQPDVGQLQNLYLVAAIFYLLLVWRLWPKEVADYRV